MNGFSLVELMLSLSLGLGLSGVMLQGLMAEGQNIGADQGGSRSGNGREPHTCLGATRLRPGWAYTVVAAEHSSWAHHLLSGCSPEPHLARACVDALRSGLWHRRSHECWLCSAQSGGDGWVGRCLEDVAGL